MLNATYVITDNGIVLMLNGKHQQVPQDHPNFARISDKLVRGDYEGLEELMDARAAVRKWLGHNPRFKLTNDLLELDGRPFSDAITGKVLSMIDSGNNPEALINFLVKVRKNPSSIAQNELLLFCVANGFMIHEDGDILAYKSVRENWTDMHSGTVFNKPAHLMNSEELLKYGAGALASNGVTTEVDYVPSGGRKTVVSMERNAVDDNRDRTCSYGLHFAAHEYARSFGSGASNHMLLLKLSPSDVVSIPSDYSNQKGRCARYVVEAELETRQPLPHKEVYSDSDYLDDTDEDTFDDERDCQCVDWQCHCDGDCEGDCDCESHDHTDDCDGERYCKACGYCHD